jgi:hypothetical protein
LRQPLSIPDAFGEVHHEVELAVLIGATLKQATEPEIGQELSKPFDFSHGWPAFFSPACRSRSVKSRAEESGPAVGKIERFR